MVAVFSKWSLYIGLNAISIFKYKHRYRSCVHRYILKKAIEREFSLPLGKFYMLCVHVMYSPSSKLSFHMQQSSQVAIKVVASNTSQTTLYKLCMFSCCVILHKSCICYFDSCKILTTWCVLINYNMFMLRMQSAFLE